MKEHVAANGTAPSPSSGHSDLEALTAPEMLQPARPFPQLQTKLRSFEGLHLSSEW